ncbi:MAG: hypothetical protein V1747_07075 [Candidatus Omnitrophota bacterium]
MKYIFASLFFLMGIGSLLFGEKVYGEGGVIRTFTLSRFKKFSAIWTVVVKIAVGIGFIIMAVIVLFKL